jgi:acid phosphatase (class A)
VLRKANWGSSTCRDELLHGLKVAVLKLLKAQPYGSAVFCRASVCSLLVMAGLAQQAHAQSGYLAGREVDFRTVLAPPPAVDSPWDHADQELVEALQAVDDARWQMAEQDADELYPRFAESFGRPIDRKTSPALIALLDRSVRDVEATAAAAKDYFHRPRPFQRLQLQRVCDKRSVPKPEAHPTYGVSYPSGHSTRGWAVAMILARVAPERAEALMKRAAEYEESRLICGMHFPTDVEAGQAVAIAVVAHLDASNEFQADLARARKEYASRNLTNDRRSQDDSQAGSWPTTSR